MATVMILPRLINTATTIKLIKIPQQINYRFDINKKPCKFCFGRFFNVKVIQSHIGFS